MVKRKLTRLGTVRALALLGVIVLATTTGYWMRISTLYPGTGRGLSMYTVGHLCDAGLREPDRVILLDKPYDLTMTAVHHTGLPSAASHCTLTIAVSAPQFEVTPSEIQSVSLAKGESAVVTWTLIPRQTGTHTVTIDWPAGDRDPTRHVEWRVAVTDSAFERTIGLTPGQIEKIGWVLGIGLLLPYFAFLFLAPFYRILRRLLAFLKREHSSE